MSGPTLRHDCDLGELGPRLAPLFRPLAPDADQARFVAEVGRRPHGFLATKLMAALSTVASSYDVHGMFGAYEMHLLSSRAFGELLEQRQRDSLLDVGAGAGYVTECARPWFREVVCTESSPKLRARLLARGFTASDLDLTHTRLPRTFDVVACLNVLDRTARPLSLLRSLRDHVGKAGMLLLSIPLPPAPHVHVRGGTSAPSERLPSVAASFERAARELSERMIEPAGLRIERFARVPYLSRGDAHAPMYVLDAALWVCRPER